MPELQRIDSLADPRVDAYRNMRERTLRGESLFITEGLLLLERLLASPYGIESVLASDASADQVAELLGRTRSAPPVYVAPTKEIRELVGFPFHRGALAIGRRPERTPDEEERLFFDGLPTRGASTIVAGPSIVDSNNVGLLFRCATAFEVDAILLGAETADPLSRRALRLSMGASLQIPFLRTERALAIAHRIQRKYGHRLVGTVLDDEALPLTDLRWPERTLLAFGHEFDGLSEAWLDLCDVKTTIPMPDSTDSLNLAISAGIFLHARRFSHPAPESDPKK